jgi:hypothetical protein
LPGFKDEGKDLGFRKKGRVRRNAFFLILNPYPYPLSREALHKGKG